MQSDGKIVLGSLLRLNADGSVDNSFNSGSGISGSSGFGSVRVDKVAVQADGKILIGGHFAAYNGTSRILLARLNNDGSLDESFDASANFSPAFDGFYGQVYTMEVQPDGKILIGGNYGNTNSEAFGVDRLNPDGSLDESFELAHSTEVRNFALGLQSDGKVLAANVNFGLPSEAFVVERYNSDGSLDSTFPQKYVNNDVKDLIIQNDGNITFVGYFTYNPIGIMRLLGDTPMGISPKGAQGGNFRIYPNPTSDLFVMDDLPLNCEVNITDASGKPVFRSSPQREQLFVQTTTFCSGMYVIQVLENGHKTSQKLVIQKH